MPDACFCESIRHHVIRQPANTLSGLAFVAVAAWIWTRRDAAPRNTSALAAMFASTALVVGIGTMLYHASLTFWGQTLDVFGMYLVVTLVIAASLGRNAGVSPRAQVTAYAISNALLLAALIAVPVARRYVFAALVIGAIVCERITRDRVRVPRARTFAHAMLVLFAGFVIWVLDITRIACAPDSWLQGHAVWHVCGALALALVFEYYRRGAGLTAADGSRILAG